MATAVQQVAAVKEGKTKLEIGSTYKLNSGYEIPLLGFGVYLTPADVAEDVVKHAISSGYRHVDSAIVYGNEAPSAAGVKASKVPRSEVFYTTKIPTTDLGYETAKKHIEESLERTGFDYIDLYLIHAPFGGKENRLGAWKALVEGVEAGKIRSIGVSNYGVRHLEELEAYIKETDEKEGKGKGGVLSVNQVELHPWLTRNDIVDWCQARGVVLEAYCPILRNKKADDPLLVPLAEKYKKTTTHILLRWSLQKGFVPLPKSVTHSRIEANTELYDFELTPKEVKSLETGEYFHLSWDPTVSED